jgi:hypothetical protein
MVRSEGNMSLKNPVTRPGIDPGTFRLVAQRLNYYATSGPEKTGWVTKRKSLLIRNFTTNLIVF